jgi:chitinase
MRLRPSAPSLAVLSCTALLGVLGLPIRVSATLPAHLITGYWENFNNGATVLKLRDVPAAYNIVAVAFAAATATPGQVTFSLEASTLGYSGNAEFISDIAQLHSQGRKVILSIGGANGTIAVDDSTAASAFSSSVVSLMNQYGFDGVDIDLEHGITPTALAQGLRAIATARPGVIITMAPPPTDMETTSSMYMELALSILDILTVANTQFYNSGTKRGCDGNVYTEGTEDFITSFVCLEIENGLPASQVGIGTPASPSAAGGGYLDPSLIVAALDCLETGTSCGSFHPPTTYPGLRGVMAWNANWDAANGDNWINTLSAAFTSGKPCAPGTTILCIDNNPGDERFSVEVHFATSQGGGQSGSGHAIPLGSLGVDHGGLMWFFSASNPEMLIKVINGCAVNNFFWIFYSAGTNVGFTVTVTDTSTGISKAFTNKDLTAAPPVQDTSAFACS